MRKFLLIFDKTYLHGEVTVHARDRAALLQVMPQFVLLATSITDQGPV